MKRALGVTIAILVAACGSDGATNPGDAGGDAPVEAEVDAGGTDAASDANDDVTSDANDGPVPLTCPGEGLEPNDREVLASGLPQITDCDGSVASVPSVSSGTADVDFFRFRGKDTTGCTVDPTVKIDVTGLRLCAFIMCTDGATTIQQCTNGSPATSPAGTKGCCTTSTTEMTVKMNCTGISDDADVFVRVDQPSSDKCVSYKVDYHY